MKFLSIYKTAERGVPPTQEEMAKMGKLVERGSRPAGCSPPKAACPAPWARA